MRTLGVLLCALLLPVHVAHATVSNRGRLSAAQKTLESGVYAKTPAAMIQARAEFEAMSKAQPKSAELHYWMAVADWRLAPRMMEKKTQAERYVKEGLQHADQALKLDPKLAEALALKASLLGLSIQIDPSVMMSVGPEIEANMQRAVAMAPDNPRVALLDGIGTLHKPEFVGGGPEKALIKLKRAQALFDAGVAGDGTAPNWGRFESYVWAGRSAANMGDRDAARLFYERALEIQPENGWVRHVLLPELDQADSTSTRAKSGS